MPFRAALVWTRSRGRGVSRGIYDPFKKLNDIEIPRKLHAWLVTTARRKTWKLKSKREFMAAVQPE